MTVMGRGVAIRLEGLARHWGGKTGVLGIDLDVPAGAFVTLLGPSGCGKSTTLRLIAGLEAPDAGRVLIDGRDMTGVPPDHRRLAMVFQSYALFPHLNVAENILFGLKVRKTPPAECRERLARTLALTGLEGLEHRRPNALSGGQRQRVALARAIVAGHPLCLMDEPLSNLDAKLRLSVRREIRALQRQLGMTVVYVTHDQTEAMNMADLVVLMRDGRIEQAGRPEEIYERPASAFAAGFVGSPPMALVPAELIDPARPGAAGMLVGLRAERLSLAPITAARARAVVRDAEYLGGESYVTIALAGAPDTALSIRVSSGRVPETGAEVGVMWPDDALHLFDRIDGRRLPCPADHAHAGVMTSSEALGR